ncbi:hypothetical protein B0H19DRAFT_1375222 [Mycena capillaripes]|nr:hypothetical protein B0H19DRAFT_1375222 [Mycena capillaripes]
MSILTSGVYTSSVVTSLSSSVTVLSSEFVWTRLCSPNSNRFAFTVNCGPHGSFTMELACSVSSTLATDVSMGLDWKAGVQEWLISQGLRPQNGFEHLHAVPPVSPSLSSSSPAVGSPSGVGSSLHDSRCTIPIVSGTTYVQSGVHPPDDPDAAPLPHSGAQPAYAHGTHPAYVHGSTSVYVHDGPSHTTHYNEINFEYMSVCPSTIAGPSRQTRRSGPINASVGLDALFLSPKSIQNVLVGDDDCLHSHMALHGIRSDGLSLSTARQALAFHLMSEMANGQSHKKRKSRRKAKQAVWTGFTISVGQLGLHPVDCDSSQSYVVPFRTLVKALFRIRLISAVEFSVGQENVADFFAVLKSTEAAIAGSTLPLVLVHPLDDVEDWMPNNLNIYPPLGRAFFL